MMEPTRPFSVSDIVGRVLLRLRRRAIRLLIGRMEVCTNMAIDGRIEYSGRYGGAIVENNRFIQREYVA